MTTHAREGDPADAILDVAEETKADLVIVGNKGMTGARRFLLGSVPNKISHHAPCSVLIVPRRTEVLTSADEQFMRLALAEAERAAEHDDVPIGAVVVRDGDVDRRRRQRAGAARRPHRARRGTGAARGRGGGSAAGGSPTRCST